MLSPRRLRLLVIVVVTGLFVIYYFGSILRQAHETDLQSASEFYQKTVNALERSGKARDDVQQISLDHPRDAGDIDADGDLDQDDKQLAREMSQRLKAAEKKAKSLANAKSPHKPDSPKRLIGVGSSAAGQKSAGDGIKTDEDRAAEVELNNILAKSDVIIFSKTFCPFSTKAKQILLDKYKLDPVPYIVELDQIELGSTIQARLAGLTGLKTVPNILVAGKSIGGGDDIVALDKLDALAAKITSLASRVKVALRESSNT